MDVEITGSKGRLSPDDLKQTENLLGISLPESYRIFLLRHNGGYPRPSDFNIQWSGQEFAVGWKVSRVDYFLAIHDGKSASLIEDFRRYGDQFPTGTLPIAADPSGNYVLLGLNGGNRGKLFFWIHDLEEEYEQTDFGNLGFLANNIDEFLKSLF